MVPTAAVLLTFDLATLIHGSTAGATHPAAGAGATHAAPAPPVPWDRSARSWSVPSTC